MKHLEAMPGGMVLHEDLLHFFIGQLSKPMVLVDMSRFFDWFQGPQSTSPNLAVLAADHIVAALQHLADLRLLQNASSFHKVTK